MLCFFFLFGTPVALIVSCNHLFQIHLNLLLRNQKEQVMPSVNKYCDIYNAFNFKRDLQEKLGHVTSLKIGEANPSADLTLKEPISEGDVKCVGAISSFDWNAGDADPLSFSCQVSITNKNNMASLIHTQMKSVAVEVDFAIYDYDPDAKAYYKAVWVDSAIKGVLKVEGNERDLHLADEASTEVQQPLNYTLNFGIQPEDNEQQIHMAVSQKNKFVKQWGVTKG